jgi:hypothetical protein
MIEIEIFEYHFAEGLVVPVVATVRFSPFLRSNLGGLTSCMSPTIQSYHSHTCYCVKKLTDSLQKWDTLVLEILANAALVTKIHENFPSFSRILDKSLRNGFDLLVNKRSGALLSYLVSSLSRLLNSFPLTGLTPWVLQ